jgi:Uma2 family endonuclease
MADAGARVADPPNHTPDLACFSRIVAGSAPAMPSRMHGRHGKIAVMEPVRDPFVPTPPPGQDDLPYDDGEPMETLRHREQMNLLIDSLDDEWRAQGREDYCVGGNMFVYYSELQVRKNDFRGPDVFVVLGTDRRKQRKSWVAWEEGGLLPNVVIELTSHTTFRVDREEKFRIYERIWKTGHYVMFDPYDTTFDGWMLSDGVYVPIARDARGDVPIASLGLALGVRPGDPRDGPEPWLRWIDPAGSVLPSGRERADAARQRADAEQQRADALAARVAELEAALAKR